MGPPAEGHLRQLFRNMRVRKFDYAWHEVGAHVMKSVHFSYRYAQTPRSVYKITAGCGLVGKGGLKAYGGRSPNDLAAVTEVVEL